MPATTFGSELDINEEVSGGQFEPQVMTLSDGRVLVTWFGEDTDIDPSVQGIAARVGTVQPDGTIVWTAAGDVGIAVNTSGYQQRPRVTELDDGRLLFTWQGNATPGDASGWGIAARIGTVQVDGTISWATAGEFRVNVNTSFDQYSPQVTQLPDGRVLFTWTNYAGTDGSSAGISGRVGTVQADGSISWATAGEFVINEETSGIQATDAPILVLGDGRVLVVWNSDDADVDGSSTGVAGRIGTVQADGSITWGTAGEFTLSEEGQNIQDNPRVIELPDGRLLFVWGSNDPDVDGNGIGAAGRVGTPQADGSIVWAAAGEFAINEEVQNIQTGPNVYELSDGRLLFLWSSTDPDVDGSGYGVAGRVGAVQADGSILWEAGGEFVVNVETQLDQGSATAVVLPDGRVLITWQSQDPDSDGSGYAIAGRVVVFNGLTDARDDAFTLDEDGAISGGDLFADNGSGADSDGDSEPFTITAVNGSALNVGSQITLASGALLTVNADGTFDYDPNGAFDALGASDDDTDSFTYTIDDGFGSTSTATVTFTINGVNTDPVAEDDAAAASEDATLNGNVLNDNGNGADGDVDGGALTVSAVNGVGGNVGVQITLASGALLTVNANGTYSYNPNGQFEVLGVGDTATESFTYTISDGFGGTDTATVTVTINGANDTIAFSDEFDVNEEVSGGQFEPNVMQLSDGRVIAVWFGEDPDIDPSIQGIAARIGTVQADGTIAWTAAGDVGIAVNTSGYQQRPRMIELDDGRLLITWQGNATPGDSSGWGIAARIGTVQPDGTISWATAGEFRVNVSTSGDQYSPQITQLPDGRVLFTWTSYAGTDGSSAGISGRVGTVQADGSISWAAAGEFVINEETSGIQAGDGPILQLSDGRVLVIWNSADGDVDGSGTGIGARIGTVQANGSISWGSAGEFTVNEEVTGSQDYPRAYELADGRVLFVWTSADADVDGAGLGISARIGMPQPDGSIAWAGGEFTVNEEVAGDQSSPNVVFLPDGRVLFLFSSTDPDVDGSGYGVAGRVGAVQADGTIVWDPAGEFRINVEGQNDQGSQHATVLADGRVLITWQGNDPDQDGSSYAITGRVMLFNNAPGAQDDAFAINENGALAAGDLFADNGAGVDGDADVDALTISAVNGSALNVGTEITLASGALLTVNASGAFDYDPNGAFDGLLYGQSDTDSFTYTISDGFGGTDTATVTITINGINTIPVAQDDAASVDEDASIAGGNLFANNGAGVDSDADGHALSVSAVNGSALNVGIEITLASGALLTVNANGTYSYNPNGAFVLLFGQSDTDSFTYTISDGFGGTDTATVTITINGANADPVAADDTLAVGENATITGGDLFDDNGAGADSDGDGHTLTITSVNGSALNVGAQFTLASGALLTVNANGTFDYDPNGAVSPFFGDSEVDSFTYTIGDGFGGSDTATVSITVNNAGQSIAGTAAPNTTSGTAYGDLMTGAAAADTLSGLGGRDLMFGGAGNDTLNGGAGDDQLDGGLDLDTLNGGDGDDVLFGRSSADTLNGDNQDDALYGGDGNDVLNGGDGDDTLDGLNNDDTASGGLGNDTLLGRQHNDTLSGDGGEDELFGGDGDDDLFGGADNDLLDGGSGADLVNGGGGDDEAYGRQGNDELNGEAGLDTLYGGDGVDTITGGDDTDFIDGGNADDTISGDAGDDTLYGRQNNDTLNGGADADTLYGGDGNDTLNGGDGADALEGGNGIDTLNGGLGADSLWGGGGADTYVFNTALGGGNIDTIVSFSVAEDVFQLSASIFGALAGDFFVIGAAATSGDHRIIYDATTGALYFDADGDGAGAAVQFATLGIGLTGLSEANFLGGP